MIFCILHQQPTSEKSQQRQYYTDIKRIRPQAILRSDPTSEKGNNRNRHVTRKFIQSHCKTSLLFAHQIYFHYDSTAPCEPLVDTQQNVCGNDPRPASGKHQYKRNGNAKEPSNDEQIFSPRFVRQCTGKIIGYRFYNSKNNDERKYRGFGSDPEFRFRDAW